MADEVQLTTAQTEKLLQFQDLTGIEDLDQCRTMLETHNWDMEVAVQDTFNLQEGIPSVFDASSINVPADVMHPQEQRPELGINEPRHPQPQDAAYQQSLLAEQEKERQKEREGTEGTQRH